MKKLLIIVLLIAIGSALQLSGNSPVSAPSRDKIDTLKRAIEQSQLESVREVLAQQKLDPIEKQKVWGIASGQVVKYKRLLIFPTISDRVRTVVGGVITAFGCWALYRSYTTYGSVIDGQEKLKKTIQGLDDVIPETPVEQWQRSLTRNFAQLSRDVGINNMVKKTNEIKATMPQPLDYWMLAGTGIVAGVVGIKNLYSGITCSDAKNKLQRAQEILKLIESN